MAGFKRSVTISRPIDEVFEFATNIANASRFMPGLTKIEMLTEGGMKPGAKFRETRQINGKERSAVIEILEHARPDIHTARSAMLGMRATYTFRFFTDPAGTRIDLDADAQGNILWRPFMSLIARMMEKEDGDFLNRLRDAMLASPPG